MKKTYIQPNTSIHVVTMSQHLMTTSTVDVKGNYSEGNMTDLSRRGDFWDDEEE